MNDAERGALLRGATLYDEMTAVVDERALEIVDRRRRTAIVKRRGWPVRRMLLAADLVGLVGAAVVAELLLFGFLHPVVDRNGAHAELLLFLLTLPAWVVAAKLYGQYDHDEERTDHSTADDMVGVCHLVMVG